MSHAQGQLLDCKRDLEDNLTTVQNELGLDGISSNPRGLIVIGRAHTLTPENGRKLITIGNENPELRIMIYDDFHDNTKTLVENLFGHLWKIVGTTQVYYL